MTTGDASDDRDHPPSLEDCRATVLGFETTGMPLRSYDAAVRGLDHFPDDPWLKHRAVLALARSGATEMGMRRYGEFGLAELDNEDAAALGARLDKDLAWLAEGRERRDRAAAAAAGYGRVYDRTGGYFPAINAATMRLVAGDAEQARQMATRILDQLAGAEDTGDGYYREVTAAEAMAILGDADGARAALRRARGLPGDNLAARATTRQQIRRICQIQKIDGAVLDELAAPCVIHCCGHMIAPAGQAGRFSARSEDIVADRIQAALDENDVGFAYGSLACGADILFAEAMLARGGDYHVVLPFRTDEFIDISVRPGGDEWVGRFRNCLDKAASVSFATEDSYLGDDHLFAYATRLAMGLALLRARYLDAPVRQIAVWDGQPADAAAAAGTAVDIDMWRGFGFDQLIIDSPVADGASPPAIASAATQSVGRVNRAMLFGDVKGFSRLDDRQLPLFVNDVLGAMAATLDEYGDDILFRNTWGDGIYLVFADVIQAARCALNLQIAMAGVPLEQLGLPDHIGLRLGGHYGPVYETRDPIVGGVNFFGAHVSRAARIEPITPEGCVYVSEPFAAAIALDPAREFTCDYVGTTPMAKGYGDLPMYLLRRRAD